MRFLQRLSVTLCAMAFLTLAFAQRPFREYFPMEGAASMASLRTSEDSTGIRFMMNVSRSICGPSKREGLRFWPMPT